MEENKMMEIFFSYTDEFGQNITMSKSLECESYPDGMNAELLLENFKQFLLGAGYMPETVAKIQFVEN